MSKKGDIVKVKWEDHWSSDTKNLETQDKSYFKPFKVTTIGFFYKETDKMIFLCQSIGQDDSWARPMGILKRDIIKRTENEV